MKITRQTNQNDCGVCVLNSFFNYYFHQDIYDQLLKKAHLSKDGMSIFDFEVLANQHHLTIKSYFVTSEELLTIKENKYFAIMIIKDYAYHYVIIKRKKKLFYLYDSTESHVNILTYEQLKNLYQGYFFEINKNPYKLNIAKKQIRLYHLNWWFISFQIIFNLLIFSFSWFFANLLSWTASIYLNNLLINNLLMICGFFILVTFLQGLSNWIIKTLSTKYFKNHLMSLSMIVINNLKKHNKFSLQKHNTTHFYLIDSAIVQISTFICYDLPLLITDCLMTIILIMTLLTTSWWIIYLIVFIFGFVCIITYIEYLFTNKILEQTISNTNVNNHLTSNMIEQMQNRFNKKMLDFYSNELKQNHFFYQQILTKKMHFENLLHTFSEIIQGILLVSCVFIGIKLIADKTLTLPYLTYLINLLVIFYKYFSSLIRFFIKYNTYKKMSKIFWLLNDETIKAFKQIDLNNLSSFYLINDQEKIEIKQNEIVDQNFNLNHSSSFEINNENVSLIDFQQYYIELNPDANINYQLIEKTINLQNPDLVNALKFFNFNIHNYPNNINSKQIILFLFLLTVKNKIININDCFRYLNLNQQAYINDVIKNKVSKENFIFYTYY